jgi:hypothetical protein
LLLNKKTVNGRKSVPKQMTKSTCQYMYHDNGFGTIRRIKIMLIGYARVSTRDQNLDLQVEALKKNGCNKIYKEIISGVKAERKILNETLSYLRPGDTLVVWRLDRLGRSLRQLIELINAFKDREVGFKSIVEAIDTTTPTGQFFFSYYRCFCRVGTKSDPGKNYGRSCQCPRPGKERRKAEGPGSENLSNGPCPVQREKHNGGQYL